MRAAHYCLALVPIGAVWLYVLGQSGRQLGELIDGIAGAAARQSSQEEPPSLPMSAAANAIVTPPEAPEAAAEPPREVIPEQSAPPRYAPAPLPVPYVAEPAEQGAAEHHPEITDPTIRRRLQAAWDD